MKKLRKMYLVAFVFLALSIASFAVAAWYFWRANGVYDIYNRYVEVTNGIPGPRPNPEWDWPYFRGFIVAWQAVGFGLTLIGIACLVSALFFYKKTRAVKLMPILRIT